MTALERSRLLSRLQPQCLVFFDGSCPLCRAEIDVYRRQDDAGNLSIVDVSRPAATLPSGLDAETAMARFHVQTRDGNLLSGARAFAHLWKCLPGWRILGHGAELPGIVDVLEIGYRLTLTVRPQLVRLFLRLSGRATGKTD